MKLNFLFRYFLVIGLLEKRCFGSSSFLYGSGSSDPCHDVDSDPAPAKLYVSDRIRIPEKLKVTKNTKLLIRRAIEVEEGIPLDQVTNFQEVLEDIQVNSG